MADAILISYSLETEEPPMHTYFSGPDAVRRAWELWEGIKDDWPGWDATVKATKKARLEWASYQLGVPVEELEDR